MISDELVRIARGEVLADDWSRQIYSVDASHYEIAPEAIVCPVDEGDVQEFCRYAHSKKIPITGRGAGTGLLGQSLSSGLVMDFTRHMNRLLEVADNYVVVQPGMVKGVLDKELKKRNKFLPPDPASSNYCTIGGMIADNSSGVHCLGFGNTIDFVEELDIIYADGAAGFASAARHDGRMARLKRLLGPSAGLINNGYPKVSKNSCGYRLDTVLREGFSPQKVFAASEGTLGLVTSARLSIMDLPERRCLLVLGFGEILAATATVPEILGFSPVALELLDHTVISHDRKDATGCLVYAEFAGEGAEDRMDACRIKLAGKATVIEYASDESSLTGMWAARKGALNDIMKMTVGSRRPIGLIEDTVVPPAMLMQHTASLLAAYRENRLDYVMYGHIGDGNLHTRPLVDIASRFESEMIERLAESVFSEVIRAGGTITGEHGDGIARTGYIEQMYGSRITAMFRQVKELFDPGYLLNPGKKVPIV